MTLTEDILFCKYVKTRATAEELFNILDTYLAERDILWENCVGFCSDGAQTMAGKINGLQALIKRVAPDAQWMKRSRQGSSVPDLNEILNEVVSVVNFIKTRPLKARLFSALCEEMEADHKAVLFHSEARWLSRGKVLSRVFELRAESRLFLEEERMYEVASKFTDDIFLIKLAYLSNVFEKLNELNLQLQGKDKPLPHLAYKITGFTRKLEVWGRRLDPGRIDAFENLGEIAETTDSGATPVIPCFKQHITSLLSFFQKYFRTSSAQYDWIMDPFNAAGWYHIVLGLLDYGGGGIYASNLCQIDIPYENLNSACCLSRTNLGHPQASRGQTVLPAMRWNG